MSPSEATPRERLAIAYTKAAMADSNAVPDALMDELATVGDRGAVNVPITSWLS